MFKQRFWIVLTIIFILIDQLTKFLAQSLGWSIFLNNQFAFSLPLPTLLMYVIYFAVIIGIGIYLNKTWMRLNRVQHYAWTLVLAGGLSNVSERIILGHVRDFIPIANGMLNVADFFILIGLLLLLASSRYQENHPNEKVS